MQKFFRAVALCPLAALSGAACEEAPPTSAAPLPAASSIARKSDCTGDGYLRGRILGAIEADVDWQAEGIACTGGPRPDGAGARLRFARESRDGSGLAVIVAIPGLSRRATGDDLVANVTVIIEGEARFFSTRNREDCWADISDNEPLGSERYAIAGELYCIAALAEVNGDASVTLDGFSFRGIVDWGSR